MGLIFTGIGLIISSIFGLIVYILSALGLHTLAKRAGLKHGWIAWIPICQWYLLGELIGDKLFGISGMKWILVLAPIVLGIVGMFTDGFFFGVLTLLVYILEVGAYYKLFRIYKPQSALFYTITGFIISPLLGLYLFLIRNNQRVALPE